MVYLDEMPEGPRNMIVNQELPDYEETRCVGGPPLSDRKIAIVTTAGLHRREDKHFTPGLGEYRIIPNEIDMDELIMSHVSTNFDRTGFYQDVNLVLPVERLKELSIEGQIGEPSEYHYSFMGATPPVALAAVAEDLAKTLKNDWVNGVVLAGVLTSVHARRGRACTLH